VSLVDTLPTELTWTLPPGCTAGGGGIVTCDLGDLAGGASVDLFFTATPGADDCGTFTNVAEGFIGSNTTASSADSASVEVPCQPQPDDPAILITKTPISTSVVHPDPVTYIVTAENVGPGDATDVQFTDELPAGATWSIGSGSNVCSITGTTLSCFAPAVPDGVFEVVEIVGTFDSSVCGAVDNSASIAWTGGPDPQAAVADAETVQVSGCSATAPTGAPNPTGDTGAGGDVPDTQMAPPGPAMMRIAVFGLLLGAGLFALVMLRLRPRP
jgi:large repetitive protein